MRDSFMISVAVGIVLMGGNASATNENKGQENWDGSVEFSASTATGNTENLVLGARLEGRRVLGRYTHDIKSGVNYAEVTTRNDEGIENDRTTQNNWFGQYRLEVHAGDKTFYYARARYEEDEFSGFDSRSFLGAGVGHTLLERPGGKWSILAGPGVQHTMLESTMSPEPEDFEESQTEVAFYGGSDLKWLVNEHVTFEHDLDLTIGETNTTASTIASLKSKLTKSISSRLSYRVKHETDPPVNREATDTLLRASVVYGF